MVKPKLKTHCIIGYSVTIITLLYTYVHILKDVIIFCGFYSQLVICKIFVPEFLLTKLGLLQMENRINVNSYVWHLQGKMPISSLPAAAVEAFFNVVTTLLACSGLLTLFNSFPTTKIADCDISEGNLNALNIYIYIYIYLH